MWVWLQVWPRPPDENKVKGTSKNWILINFIEKPFFNQFMSVFAMKF